jgi:hypothetical protein
MVTDDVRIDCLQQMFTLMSQYNFDTDDMIHAAVDIAIGVYMTRHDGNVSLTIADLDNDFVDILKDAIKQISESPESSLNKLH